jgi:hypothetical protein
MMIGFGGLSGVDTADTTASLAQTDAATAQIAVDTKTPTINFLRLGFTFILLFGFYLEIDLIASSRALTSVAPTFRTAVSITDDKSSEGASNVKM